MTPNDMEAVAWRTVPVEPTEAMLVNGREALMPLARLDSYGPLIGVWKDMLEASPVVPAPEGEAWKALRRVAEMQADGERTKSVMIANWIIQGVAEAASPVVPVGREEIARIIDPAAFLFERGELDEKVYSRARADAFNRADAILAALGTKATDTGREG